MRPLLRTILCLIIVFCSDSRRVDDDRSSLEAAVCKLNDEGMQATSAGSCTAQSASLRAEGRIQEAFECAVNAARLAPDDMSNWILSAETASLLGKEASPSECFLRGKAARRFKKQGSPRSHLERSAAYARCLAAAGKCESAAKAMAKVEKSYPDDYAVAFLSSTELAQLAMAGTCGWKHADASFESLHARFQPTADSMRNAALVKTQLSMFEEAEKLFARSISIRDDAYTRSQMAVTCGHLNKHSDALVHSQRAFALQPSSEHALAVGSLLVKLARYAEAEPLLRSAYNSLPSETAASRELGICALGLGRFSEAGNLLEAAGEGGEGDFRVYVLAASALTKASEHPRAAKCYAKAADRCVAGGGGQEECDLARGRLMEARQRVCDWGSWGAYAALEARLVQRRSRERVLSPFQVAKGPFSGQALLAVTSMESAKKMPSPPSPLPPLPPLMPGGRMRVGFLWAGSHESEFCNNVVSLIERFPSDRFELFWITLPVTDGGRPGRPRAGGGDDLGTESEWYNTTARLRTLFPVERTMHVQTSPESVLGGGGQGDEAASGIRDLGLHLLINLPGWLNEAAMSVSVAAPSALQMAYKGYPGTLGAEGNVQHIATDRVSSPPELSHIYSEKVVYMPATFYPVANAVMDARDGDTFAAESKKRATRAGAGIPEEATIVFGAFNDHYKVDPAIFTVWMRLLKTVHGSVLWTMAYGGQDSLREQAAAHGVDPDRIVVSPYFPKHSHIAIKSLADLFLDTPLYNAHSTLADMLWGGLPVVTLPSEKMSARIGSSIALASRCGFFVARNIDDYEHLALRIVRARLRAPDRARLAEEGSFNVTSQSANLARGTRMVYEAGPGMHVAIADLAERH